LVDKGLGCSDVHDSIIAVFPLHIDVELFDAFLVGDFKHFLMDNFTAGVKFPITVFVAHGIANC
jgi:hypothetical protein